ncbi:MAG TPA: putative toxin-antitoxin system toxin component, PIN family [Nitrospirae bacterium]|nr:PIN domain protein [bacterium BMS3Abin10]GBE38625.1 PIN domain protein [bacterium BMS3Bbin08]HDH51612.1 putative toxin-antitoxin system toxin component, PIN family [Nitrospirota bacterium]HDK82612.1 putative toxin-antitoxin system toxin component, PIN family [Nitrospirota bacterium]
MVKKKIGVKKVVLDTNVIVSALLFKGELSAIVNLWKEGEVFPVISNETFKELTKVFTYPKFSLTEDEIRKLIEEEIVPYFELISTARVVENVCQDPDDDKFLSCALSASADFIVSGDKDLTGIKQYKNIKIINPHNLLQLFEK